MDPSEIDFRALFEASPGPAAVLRADSPRFTILAASDAYLVAGMRDRANIVGRPILEAFPDNPDDSEATGTRNLRASLERVIATGEADRMSVQRYDIRRPDGAFEERHWSPLNVPLKGPRGAVELILHQVEDLTLVVHAEAALTVRARELDRANMELRIANDRIVALGESQLRVLFDVMPQLGWTARADGSIEFYNRGWYEYTGTTLESMQGWGWKGVHDPAHLEAVVAAWQTALATGTPFEMEFPLRRHDGVFRWFLTRVNPVRDAEGRIVRWVGINTDIDDRRRAGSRQETRLRLLLESIRDYALFMLDIDGRISTWTPAAERLAQWTEAEIIGKPFAILYPSDDVGGGKPAHQLAVAKTAGMLDDEGLRKRRDGSEYWASVTIDPARDEDGQLAGYSVVMRDLSERRRAERERIRLAEEQEARKALEESEERLRFLADASAILGASLDYEETLQTLATLVVPRNADWCSVEVLEEGQLFPVAVAHADPEKIALAKELRRRWPPRTDTPAGVYRVLRTGKSELYPHVSEAMIAAGAQDEEHLRITLALKLRSALIVPLVARGTTLGALTLVWAETERSYAPSDVPLMEELGRRAGIAVDNARLYRQAQKAVRLRDEFLTIASHELKTPLTTISLQLSALRRGLRSERQLDVDKATHRAVTIDDNVHRLAALIEDLLDVSRATADRIVLEPTELDLEVVVSAAIEAAKTGANAVGCEISFSTGGSVRGWSDERRLGQLVTHLLSNAQKYGPGKPIRVDLRRNERTAVLTVRDQGIGIAPADQARIFERFGRAVPAENYGGLGLGLWIVKQLVDAMGGTIEVESALGEGACFRVVLPLDELAG